MDGGLAPHADEPTSVFRVEIARTLHEPATHRSRSQQVGASCMGRCGDRTTQRRGGPGEATTQTRRRSPRRAPTSRKAVAVDPQRTRRSNERAAGCKVAPCLVAHACTLVCVPDVVLSLPFCVVLPARVASQPRNPESFCLVL